MGLMAVAGGKSYIMMSYVDLFSEMHFRSHIYIYMIGYDTARYDI